MSHAEDKMDPELRGLLEEISEQEEAQLLKVDSARARKLLYPSEPGVGARAAFLTNAERHLLLVHRAEVARMLYRQASVLLHTDPSFGRHLVRSPATRETLEPSGRAELDRESKAAATGLSARESDPAAELLMVCCSKGTPAGPADMLLACLRLAPADNARVCLALALLHDGDASASRKLLERVLGSRPSSLIQSYAWVNLGLIASLDGSLGPAARAYECASESGRLGPLISLFACHIDLGNSLKATAVGARIQEIASADDQIVQDFIDDLEASRLAGRQTLFAPAQELDPSVLGKPGTAPHAIAHALI